MVLKSEIYGPALFKQIEDYAQAAILSENFSMSRKNQATDFPIRQKVESWTRNNNTAKRWR